MESGWVTTLAAAVVSLVLPNLVLLVWGVPALMVLSSAGVLGPVLSVGDADIQAFDVVLTVVALRIASSVMVGRRALQLDRVYGPIAAFLGVLLMASILAYLRLGAEVFLGQAIALSRFVAQVAVVALVAQASAGRGQVGRAQTLLDCGGYVIAATFYLNLWLFQAGRQLGEVQAHEGIVRYFGPLGDQVGFILLYFIYKALIVRKVWKAGALGVAVVLTGTRGALLALTVGIALLAWRGRAVRHPRRWLLAGLAFCAFLGSALWLDLGGMRSRFLEPELLQSGAVQRQLTAAVALRVFADNLLTGVGFTGFRYVAAEYGAVDTAIQRMGGFAPQFTATAGNQYLQVATDGGVIALAIFIWMILAATRSLRWAAEDAPGNERASFAAGYVWLLSLAFGNQTAAWVLPGSLISYLLWVLLGLSISVRADVRQTRGRQTRRIASMAPVIGGQGGAWVPWQVR